MDEFARDSWRHNLNALKKKPWQLYENILGIAVAAGIDRCAEGTLAPVRKRGRPVSWKTLQRRYTNFMRHFPPGIIETSVCVLDYDANGSAHYHLFLVFKDNVRLGFNCSARRIRRVVEKLAPWVDLPAHLQQLCGALRSHENANDYLEFCRSVFRDRALASRFGLRVELNPITTSIQAYAVYLAKKYGMFGFKRPASRKGAQSVRYSRGAERIADPKVRSRFTPFIWEYYDAMKRIARAIWFRDHAHLLHCWGSKAHYYFRNLISSLVAAKQTGEGPLDDHSLTFYAVLAVPRWLREQAGLPDPYEYADRYLRSHELPPCS